MCRCRQVRSWSWSWSFRLALARLCLLTLALRAAKGDVPLGASRARGPANFHSTANAVDASSPGGRGGRDERPRLYHLVVSLLRGGEDFVYHLDNPYASSSSHAPLPPPPPPPLPLPIQPQPRNCHTDDADHNDVADPHPLVVGTDGCFGAPQQHQQQQQQHQQQQQPQPPPQQHEQQQQNQHHHYYYHHQQPQQPDPPTRDNSPNRPYHRTVPLQPPNAYLFPPGTWGRYLRATKGDAALATQRLAATLAWRAGLSMDSALARPHRPFDAIKRHYPHAFHLSGRRGEPVYYERPARADLAALTAAGVTLDALLYHYALVTEFLWTRVSADQDGPRSRAITVLDLDGLRLRDFAGDVAAFVRRAAAFTGEHYPERAGGIYVLNAPASFGVVWRLVRPLVDPITLAKVRILTAGDDAVGALMERIPYENIPREYGGGSTVPLGHAPEERMLWDLMRDINRW